MLYDVTLVLIVIALILLTGNTIYRIKEHRIDETIRKRRRLLAQALQASQTHVWTYDIASSTFIWMDKDFQPQRHYTNEEFARRHSADDNERLHRGMDELISQKKTSTALLMEEFDEERGEHCINDVTLSLLCHKDGNPRLIVGTNRISGKSTQLKENLKEQSYYQSIFDTVMVDMALFDGKGYLLDMNNRAQHTYKMPLKEALKRKVRLDEVIDPEIFKHIHSDTFHSCMIMNRNKLPNGLKLHQGDGTIVYELQLVPVNDNHQQLKYIFGTGRNITKTVRTYQQVQQNIKEITKTTKEVKEYIKNIDYVLEVGGIILVDYSPDSHTLSIYRGQNIAERQLTQMHCLALIDDESKKTAAHALNLMDNRVSHTVDIEIKTLLHQKGHHTYLRCIFDPTLDAEGNVIGYHGQCCNQSDMKETELLLEKETTRAQEIENLKNSFLRNMSYEIRTPLNTVVGFAELLEQNYNAEDEQFFIEEIKKGSAHLLDLINDILFLSRLDAHMIEINKQPVDFAMTFEGHCQMGWLNQQKDNVRYVVENRYEHLVVDIDDTNLGRVIEQVITNAAQHTSSGFVRARYDYIDEKLVVAVEDTGKGISKELLEHIYERFSAGGNGTGLGLPICKELMEQMGGTISITSTPGAGTTVWIGIPCTMKELVRKNNS